MAKQVKVDPAGSPALKKSKSTAKKAKGNSLLDEISAQLKQGELNKNVLLNIPIWGWTGDGKTCAMLTAIHYCDPYRHPFEFSFVTNPDEIAKVEASKDEYKGHNLAGLALATTERLHGLMEQFIDNNEWLPGTDEPSSNILAIRRMDVTLGYAIFPDIQGGSFLKLDEIAREVLQNAHAAMMFVNPKTYSAKSFDGKRYRDDIFARIQYFAEEGVPVCMMISKADRYHSLK